MSLNILQWEMEMKCCFLVTSMLHPVCDASQFSLMGYCVFLSEPIIVSHKLVSEPNKYKANNKEKSRVLLNVSFHPDPQSNWFNVK